MSVLERFEQQAKLLPESIAVRTKEKFLTYRQLDERANQIAFALKQAGAGTERIVGLFLNRTVDLASGLLGIWKAGGAYLPLDPDLPVRRLSFMLEDCKADFLLTEKALLSSLPAFTGPVICVEGTLENDAPAAKFFESNKPLPDQLAYILFTSGSTGQPKGAAICHGGIENNIEQSAVQLELSPADIVLAMAAMTFDMSCLEFFSTLANGACLHIVDRNAARDGLLLMKIMRESGATVAMGTPTFWSLLLDAGWAGDPKLKIVTGGEALPLALGRTLAKVTRAVWNHYGPTETTISVTTEKVKSDAEIITVGKPLENTRVDILDEERKPVPKGEVGEIYIGGICVGRGYVNRDDLTRACFLPDPFNSTPGARIYKTGDLGRELPDSRIEYLGRKDDQVKIRGYRIELKEIEEAIRSCEGIRAVCVLAMEAAAGDKRLVAFVQSEPPLETDRLKEHLRQSLPAYMIPSEYVEVKEFPITPNGKVDRAALKSLRPIVIESRTIIGPRDKIESLLKECWERVLKINPISVQDNFFELGGNSFLAARLFTEIQRKLGRRIPLSLLIEQPTIEALAGCIRQPQSNQEWPGVVKIRGTGKHAPLFIAHGLGGSVLIFLDLVEKLSPDLPIYGLQLESGMVENNEQLTIPRIASLYIQQMKAVCPSGPYHVAGHSLGALVAYEVVCQLAQARDNVGLLALFDWDLYTPFSAKPLFPSIAETASPVSFLDRVRLGVRSFAKKVPRAFQAGGGERIYRKYHYEKLRAQYLLLKHFPMLGRAFPNAFREDVYIALSTQSWMPQSFPGDAVVFMATDQLRAHRNFGAGWSRMVQGNCEILQIPGTHQTMFHSPNVDILAEELMCRLRAHDRVSREKRPSALTGS